MVLGSFYAVNIIFLLKNTYKKAINLLTNSFFLILIQLDTLQLINMSWFIKTQAPPTALILLSAVLLKNFAFTTTG